MYYSRLTSVILQEQKFADEFLVTPRARQCIGQACRTALISPLIETLATRTHSKINSLYTYIIQCFQRFHIVFGIQLKKAQI